MYFIRLHPLKERLRDRAMTDREALPYYILLMACTAGLTSLPMHHEMNLWDVLSAIVSTALTIGGIVYCFVQNGGRSGYDFVQKAIVLGWVVSIRLALFLLVPLCVVDILAKKSLGHSSEVTSWVNTAIVATFVAIYYLRLARHIKDTNRKIGEPTNPPYSSPAAGSKR